MPEGVIFFIEPDDEEFKRVMKNARRKLDSDAGGNAWWPSISSAPGNLWHSWTTQDKICLYC